MVLADALLMRGGLAAVHLILGDDSDTTNPDLLLLHKQLATGAESRIAPHLTPVSYTHLTLPTILLV